MRNIVFFLFVSVSLYCCGQQNQNIQKNLGILNSANRVLGRGAKAQNGGYEGTRRQIQVDSVLREYERVKDRRPYTSGSDKLLEASNIAIWHSDKRPHVIIRSALYEYMLRHNIKWPEERIAVKEWRGLFECYDKVKNAGPSFAMALLHIWSRIQFIQYMKPERVPEELAKLSYLLTHLPDAKPEPELDKYYSLLQMKLNENESGRMLETVRNMRKDYPVEDWVDAGVSLILSGRFKNDYLSVANIGIVDDLISYVKSRDAASADALRGYWLETAGALEGEDRDKVKEIYKRSASKGNTLGTIRYAASIQEEDPSTALELLSRVEKDKNFSRYTGSVVKATIFSRSDNEADLREVSRLSQDAMEKCLDKDKVKFVKTVYNKTQQKLAVLELQEQEKLLDPDDALPSELTALAVGYESLDGYLDKAMEYYRMAADLGDEESLCRICIYDMRKGVEEEDEIKVRSAANKIVEMAKSDFLPFLYNAIYVKLYGLNGDAPDLSAYEEMLGEFAKRYSTVENKNQYSPKHFLGNETRGDLDSGWLGHKFSSYDSAMRNYRSALEKEKENNYKDAADLYRWASSFGHPLGYAKTELMSKKLKALKNK